MSELTDGAVALADVHAKVCEYHNLDPSQVAGQASMMSPQSSTEEENELEQQQQQPQLMVASNT